MAMRAARDRAWRRAASFFPLVVILYADVLFLSNANLLAHEYTARDFPIWRYRRLQSVRPNEPIIFSTIDKMMASAIRPTPDCL